MNNIEEKSLPGKSTLDQEVAEIMKSLVSSNYNTPEEKDFFASKIAVKRVEKGTLLLKEGQLVKASYHLFKGCVREFYHKDGEQKTTAFYIAGDSLWDDGNRLDENRNIINWECSCECIMSVFTFEVEKEMYERFPRLESLCRKGTEKSFSNYKNAINKYLSSTPMERYKELMETRPEIFQFVPQYHIASYLGLKPESLSRIRNKLRSSGI